MTHRNASEELRLQRRGGLLFYSDPVGGIRFNPNAVIDSKTNALFRSQVAFRGLDGGVAQQHLDLLQFAARCLAEPRACEA